MRTRNAILLIVAALIVSGVGTMWMLRSAERRAVRSSRPNTVRLLVAARDLTPGETLSDADVRLVDWPATTAPSERYTSVEAVRGLGVASALAAGEPILRRRLAEKGSGVGLPVAIPQGFRAMSVHVDDVVSVSGFVLPGTHVDVVATLPASAAGDDYAAATVLQNVAVLAAGTTLDAASAGKPESKKVEVVTLVVTPHDAEILALATTRGRIQLALRNGLDTATVASAGASTHDLLPATAKGPVAPKAGAGAPKKPAGHTIETVNGGKTSTEIVP